MLPDVASIANTVFLIYIFHLYQWTVMGFKTRFSWGNEPEYQLRMPDLEGLSRCNFRATGLEDSYLNFQRCVVLPGLKHNFDFNALFIPIVMSSWVSVSCERFLVGFHLAVNWLNFGSLAHTVWVFLIFSSAPVGENLRLEAQYSQHICQDRHRCKRELW